MFPKPDIVEKNKEDGKKKEEAKWRGSQVSFVVAKISLRRLEKEVRVKSDKKRALFLRMKAIQQNRRIQSTAMTIMNHNGFDENEDVHEGPLVLFAGSNNDEEWKGGGRRILDLHWMRNCVIVIIS